MNPKSAWRKKTLDAAPGSAFITNAEQERYHKIIPNKMTDD